VSAPCTIRGAHVLDLDAPRAMRGPADISIRDGRIAAIEPSERRAEDRGGAAEGDGEEIDARGWLAMPGLVNAHVHSSGAFNRGLVDNLPLEHFMLYELPPFDAPRVAPELYRARVLYGAVEMLRTGVTSIVDDPIYAPHPTGAAIDAVMGAYEELGVRATVTIYQPDRAEHEWFPYIGELLEPSLVTRLAEEGPPPGDEVLALYEGFVGRWHGAAGGRLRCGVSPSAPQRSTDAYLQRMHTLAAEHQLPYVVHVYESKVQRVAGELLYGGSLVRHMRELGVLDERACVVHAVWVDDEDIADLAASGATVVHSPSGNLRCGSGQLPYRRLLDAGVPLALCTDEATVEDTNNLWNVGRLAALVHKNAGPDYRSWPTAREILTALTAGGARAMGLEGEVGVLDVGARADIVMLDLDSPVFLPLIDLPNHLVYGEHGRSVRMVMVDGRVVVRDGKVLTIDEDALIEEVRALMPAWLEALESAEAWARRLRPAFDEMYRRCSAEDVGFTRWTG
jgi:5-methylthioadenosine/S-adenosylhomocysteine deaminase